MATAKYVGGDEIGTHINKAKVWFWYKAGYEEDTIYVKEFPVFQPDTTTSYVLKLTDFKYDITYDTVNVEVVDCKQPTSL